MASLALAFDILARDKGASKTFDKVGDSAEKAGKKGKAFGSLVKSGIGLAAGALAVGGIAKGIKDAVAEARESEKVGAITANVIKTTGGAAKVTASQVGDLATAISNKTGIDDEAVQSASNLLLTFTNVRNEVGKGNDIFNQATQAATDMASAMGKEPKAAAIQLGKALNDPIKGITALSKVGVSFTAGQKKQIKTLVDSGNTLGAQRIILGELNKEFGGTAAASATAGEKMSTAFGNFKEQIGTALLPVIDKVETFITDKAIPAVSNFIAEFQNGTGAGGRLRDVLQSVADKVKTFIAEFKSGEGAGGKFRTVLEKIVSIAQSAAKWIGDNATTVQILAGALGAGIVAFETISAVVKAYTAIQTALNVVMSANPIGLVIVAIAALVGGMVVAYKKSETFRDIVDNAWDTIKVGALQLATIAIAAFRGLTNMFLTVVSVLVTGAAKAFGWVPGLGPKLKTAAANVEGFKKSANASLAKVERDLAIKANTAAAQAAINELRRNAGKPVTMDVFMNTRYTAGRVNVAGVGAVNAGQRAGGGPVAVNRLYQVGDNPDGSWNKTTELFQPSSSGRIINQEQMRAALGVSGASGPLVLSESTLQRLAAIFSGVVLQPVISAGSVERGLMGGVRA